MGEYRGGEQIRQEALATELGVSRIPIREALLILEQEGLVVIHTHKGAVVAELSLNDAGEVFEARRLIEPFLLRLSIEKADGDAIEEAGKARTAYENGLKTGASAEELSRLNWEFHRSLCVPAERPRTLAMLVDLHNAADRYLRLQIGIKGAQAKAAEDHERIFEAFRQKDIALAMQLSADHVAAAANDVLEQLNMTGTNRLAQG